jgi:predicted HAD superfamily Cof-like phosphohydrolase
MSEKFKEAKALNGVGAFHHLFDMPVHETPSIPSMERCKLRIALLEEELNELKEAIKNNDIKEAADAFCDLQYVLSGAIHEFGLGEIFSSMFEEVQRSNMSKACSSFDEALQTQEKYFKEKQVVSEIKEKENLFLVYRSEDGKVLKSVNYSPADLLQFLK